MSIISKEDLINKKGEAILIAKNLIDVEKKICELGFQYNSESAKEVMYKIENEPFRVLVIGQFNSGKSTFINALLGELVLAMNSLPCTGVINSIKYGKTKSAKVYFKNPLPADWNSKGIQEEALKHIHDYQGNNIPPMELDISKLRDYIEIRDKKKNQKDSIKETPFEKVELEWPLELCKDGIEIIDSPGLNEDISRTKLTREYLSQADAVIFVTNCIDPCQHSEIEFISDELNAEWDDKIFFVGNRIDGIKDEFDESLTAQNQLETKEYVIEKFSEFINGPIEERVFFTNSVGALKAKKYNDSEQLDASGILELEKNLYKYLQNNRGRLKLLQSIPILKTNIVKVREQIPVYIQSMKLSLEEFDIRLREAQPFKVAAIAKKNDIDEKIKSAIEKGEKEIYDRLILQYKNIVKMIPEWVKNMKLENKMTLNPIEQKEARKNLEREIAIKLGDLIEKEMKNWSKIELSRFIESFTDELEKEIGKKLEAFYDNVDKFKYGVSGVKTDKEISTKERVAAAILACAGSWTTAPLGASIGLKETAKRTAGLFAAQVVIMMTPLGLAGAGLFTVGTAIFQYATGKTSMVNAIKKDMEKKYIQELEKNMIKISKDVATSVVNNLKDSTSPIINVLCKEIESQEALIETIKKSKADQENISYEKENMLNQYAKNCDDLLVKLDILKGEIE